MRRHTPVLAFQSWLFCSSQGYGDKFLLPAEKGLFRLSPGIDINTDIISTYSREPTISKLIHARTRFFIQNTNPVIAFLLLALLQIFRRGYYDEQIRKYIFNLSKEDLGLIKTINMCANIFWNKHLPDINIKCVWLHDGGKGVFLYNNE